MKTLEISASVSPHNIERQKSELVLLRTIFPEQKQPFCPQFPQSMQSDF